MAVGGCVRADFALPGFTAGSVTARLPRLITAPPMATRSPSRRVAREAEGAPLLREYRVKSSIEGSNPSLSATNKTAALWAAFLLAAESGDFLPVALQGDWRSTEREPLGSQALRLAPHSPPPTKQPPYGRLFCWRRRAVISCQSPCRATGARRSANLSVRRRSVSPLTLRHQQQGRPKARRSLNVLKYPLAAPHTGAAFVEGWNGNQGQGTRNAVVSAGGRWH
jgi:hypothetical protein